MKKRMTLAEFIMYLAKNEIIPSHGWLNQLKEKPMHVTLMKLPERERRVAVVEQGEKALEIYTLREIAETISYLAGSAPDLDPRQEQMLEIAEIIIRHIDADRTGYYDGDTFEHDEQEPPVSEWADTGMLSVEEANRQIRERRGSVADETERRAPYKDNRIGPAWANPAKPPF